MSDPMALPAATPCHTQVVAFLKQIGLVLQEVPALGEAGFLEDVRVLNGELHYLPNAKACNLLHEAGHVAICPGRYRHLMSDDVEAGTRAMYEQMDRDGIPPGAREWEIALQVSESEATAWSWAAGKAIGLAVDQIIEDWCFNGEGALTRSMLASLRHYGINGLAHAGYCRTSNNDRRAGVVYPALNFWLQP